MIIQEVDLTEAERWTIEPMEYLRLYVYFYENLGKLAEFMAESTGKTPTLTSIDNEPNKPELIKAFTMNYINRLEEAQGKGTLLQAPDDPFDLLIKGGA